MKRLLALLLALTMLASVSAVAEELSFSNDTSEQTYAFISFLSGGDHWRRCYIGFEEAGKQLGVQTVHLGETSDDLTAYLRKVEEAINMGVDGIAVACYNADAYIDVINKAMEAGIPVITFDSDSPNSNRLSYMSTGNSDAGAFAADKLAELIGNTGKAVILTRVGQENIEARANGFTARLAEKYPDIEIAEILNAQNDDISETASKVSAVLQANPEINCIYSAIGEIGVGAAQAVRELGRVGEVTIIASDLGDAQLELVKSGELAGTIMQGTYNMGWWTCVGLYAQTNGLLEGNPLPPYINTGVDFVDMSNVDRIMEQ
ncbi:MAG: substrate-binding domain-containing protein [Clostridia bacterium]|nr:substrate-binding domain-containing protein [Clostridia bacterium]